MVQILMIKIMQLRQNRLILHLTIIKLRKCTVLGVETVVRKKESFLLIMLNLKI
jgi:hypothetical protein